MVGAVAAGSDALIVGRADGDVACDHAAVEGEDVFSDDGKEGGELLLRQGRSRSLVEAAVVGESHGQTGVAFAGVLVEGL